MPLRLHSHSAISAKFTVFDPPCLYGVFIASPFYEYISPAKWVLPWKREQLPITATIKQSQKKDYDPIVELHSTTHLIMEITWVGI